MPAETGAPPILDIVRESGLDMEAFVHHYADLFIVHDRLMLKTFQAWAGAEKALEMHDRVWNNPIQPLQELFGSIGPTLEDRLVAYCRAFHLHDYHSMRALCDEIGEVSAIEAHHSLWVNQSTDTAIVPGHEPDAEGQLTWRELYDLVRAHTVREGILHEIVDITQDSLIVETKKCAYFDMITYEMGREAAEEHNHLIAQDSSDRTREGFLQGIGRTDEFRGVMTRHRCHGDTTCRVEWTRRDPEEPHRLFEPVSRPGTICYFCPAGG